MKNRSHRKLHLNKLVYTAVMTALLAGCGGGGGGGGGDTIIDGVTTQTINGGGVKGPLTNANVAVYRLSFGANVTVDTTAIDTGTTDIQAKIQNLALPFPLAPPYILEFTATPDTMDLATCTVPADSTTCFAPILTTMRTVITSEMLASGQNIYATPLTTMAVNIALQNADIDSSGTTDADEFLAALDVAGNQVASTLGFGMGSAVDIFNTPPLLDDSTDTGDEQAETASYRAAVEAVGAIVAQMDDQAAGNSDDVLDELTADLADGEIDGQLDGLPSDIFTDTTLAVLQQDPENLPIPNTDDGTGNPITVGNIEDELAAEAADTGATVDTTALEDGSIVVETAPAETNPDIDGDGVLNIDDAFPEDIAASVDSDGDGMPDDWHSGETTTTGLVLDDDDDNDGVADGSDDFPLNPAETTDTDGDGTGNNADTDDDGDGVLDTADAFPLNPNASQANDADGDGWSVSTDAAASQDPDDADNANPVTVFVDTDGDGLADSGGLNPDDDDDNDGVLDVDDDFPLDATEWVDTDTDGTGNNADTDDDNDTVLDVDDAFPLDSAEDTDTDGDGIGNNADTDDDGDTLSDATEGDGAVDTDRDGIPDSLDIDSDNDGYLDSVDLAPLDANITVNIAPLAADQSETVAEDGSLPITLSVTDPDAADTAGAMTYTVGAASNGTATNNADGTVTYVPDANFNGSDSFTYSATDTAGATSNTATVTITVTAQNDTPVITEGATTTVDMDEDGSPTAFSLTLNATDIESDAITWSISGAATNGTATASGTGASMAISYTPTANWSGIDSFDVQISDGSLTDTITVTVNVAAVNDAPVITEGATSTVNMDEDGSPTAFSLTLNATDTESDTITWSISGAASNGTATASGTGASRAISYTPTANFTGTDSFDVQITDGTGTDTITVTVNVAAVNDAPVISEGATTTVNMDEDGSPTAFSLTLNATDVESDAITWSISGAASNGTATASGTGASMAISYTPTANWSGTDSFDVQITDGSLTDTITVTVNVAAVNDAPVITEGATSTVNMDEDGSPTAFSLTLNATDTESEVITWSISSAATNGTATASGTGTSMAIGYAPNADFNGTDSFDVQISDGTNIDTITVTVNVATVNDAPNAVNDSVGVLVDSSNNSIDVLANDSDVEGSGLTITAVDNPSTQLGTVTTDGSTVSYTPAAAFSGTDTFTYTVSDGTDTSVATVTMTVSTNQSPVITEGATTTVNMDEDGSPTAFGLTLTATDAESDTITWSISSAATNGTATASGTGTSMVIGYTPNADFNGSDSFGVQVTDGTSTDTITVTVNVAAQNDAPAFTSSAVTAVDQGASYSYDVVASDVDTGDTLTILATTKPTWLNLTDNGNGTASLYGSPGNDNVGDNAVVLSVTDGSSAVAEQSFTIVVANVNDAPVANDDTASANIDGTPVVINVLVNDTDLDVGDTQSVLSVTQGTLGTVANNGSSVSYTNATGTDGQTDTFTYTVEDASGATAIATVTVTLTSGPTYTPVDADVAMADGVASLNHNSFNDTSYPSLVGDHYNYWTANTVTGNASYHWDGTSFVASSADRNTVRLGAAGWASVSQGIANPLTTSSDANAVSVQTRDASGNVLTDLTLSSFGEADISGVPMDQVNIGNDAWVAAVTGNDFSAGAKLYQLTLTRNQSEYELWCGSVWADAYGINGCEVAFDTVGQPITTLEGLIDVQMWHSDSYDNGTVSCTGSAMATLRGAMTSGSGTVDIYCDTDLVNAVASQTWNLVNVNGMDIVVTPANNGEGGDRMYTIYDGYVRPGEHMPAGVVGTFPLYNKTAADQMAAVFTPTATSTSSPIVGAWTFNSDGSMGQDVVVFYENGQYVMWNDTAASGATGCGGSTLETEVGTYSYDDATGALTILSHIQNGAAGFDDMSDPCSIPPAPLSVSIIDQNTVTINDYGVTAYRVTDSTSPIVGSWSEGFDWGTATATFTVFYKTGEFFNWCSQTTTDPTTDCTENNPSGIEGVETGTYEWGVSDTNMLDIISYSRDDNPTYTGISSIVEYVSSTTGISSIQATINGDCLEMPDVPIGTLYRAIGGASCGTTTTITFSGIAADAAATLQAGFNQLMSDWSDALGQDVLVYSMLSGDASTTTDQLYEWDGSAFVNVLYDTDRVLNPTTGAQEDFSNEKIISAVSTTEATIINIDGAQYGDYTVTFEAMDLTGVEMTGVLSPEWQAALINSTAQFTAGNWLRLSFTANADIYYVGMYDTSASCDVNVDVTDNCDVALYSTDSGVSWNQATSLDNFTSGAIVQVGWNDANQLALSINFDGAGGTTFYTSDSAQVGTGTYTDKVFGTTNVREFDIPADLADYTEGDSFRIFFEDIDVTMGNVVRDGAHSVPGETGQFMAIDDQALSELLSNIDGNASGGIPGTVSGTVTNNSGLVGDIYVALFADVTYTTNVGGTLANVDGSYAITGMPDGTYYPATFVDINGNATFDDATEVSAFSNPTSITITDGIADVDPLDFTIN